MEDRYSIKEVIEQRFDEMGAHLVEIKSQTTKTNGRVSSLESSRVQIWTSISVLIALGGAIIFLSIQAIDSKIKDGIETALSSYEIQVK